MLSKHCCHSRALLLTQRGSNSSINSCILFSVCVSNIQVWQWTCVWSCGQWETGQDWIIPGAVCVCVQVSWAVSLHLCHFAAPHTEMFTRLKCKCLSRMCAGPVQWLSPASTSTQMINQETSMPSPESLLWSASKPPRQVSSLTQSKMMKWWCHINTWPCILPPSSAAIKEFVLIPQHTTPTNTTKELDALYDVLQHVKKMWKTEVGHFLSNRFKSVH